MADEIYSLIANVGFPIAVAAYLLVRLEGKMDRLTEAVQQLTAAVEKNSLTTSLISPPVVPK